MSLAEKLESTVSWRATPATSCWSVMGLLRPFADGGGQDTQELVVAADTGQVALRVLGPVGRVVGGDPGALVLQVTGPHDLEGLDAVELEAAGGLDVQPRVRVVDRLREVHLDPPQGVDDVDEAVEVQLHEVLDRDPEVLLDGGDQLVGPW